MSTEDFIASNIQQVAADRAAWFAPVSLQRPTDVWLERFMFRDCPSLTEVDLSGIRARIVLDPDPFPNCPSLKRIRIHAEAVASNPNILNLLKGRECDPPATIEVVEETGELSLV